MWSIKESLMTLSKKTLVNSALALAIGAVMTGCATPVPSTGPAVFQNQVQVAESIERLELYTRPNGLELSARDQVAVSQFLQGYGRQGSGPLYINVPNSAASGLGAQQAQAVIRQSLAGVGLGGASVQTGEYQTAYGSPAPVVVSYRTLRTVPQDCRQMGDTTNTFSNQPYDSFGCFHASNLAAMINDPRQLLAPYDMTEPDSQRRQTIYDKYIAGENPASTQPDRQQTSVE